MFLNYAEAEFTELTDPASPVTWQAGGQATWKLGRAKALNKADGRMFAVAGIFLDFLGEMKFTDDSNGGTDRPMSEVDAALVKDVDLDGCWHGHVLDRSHWQGQFLDLFEYIACGQRYASRRRHPLRGADGTSVQAVQHQIFLPLGFFGQEKAHHGCMPAVCFKDGELVVNWQDASVIADGSANALVVEGTTMEVRATLVSIPVDEIFIDPMPEFRVIRTAAVEDSADLTLASLGTKTGLNNVDTGAALHTLLLMTAYWENRTTQKMGSFLADTLVSAGAEFLGKAPTKDVRALMALAEWCDGRPHDQEVRGIGSGQPVVGYVFDRSGIPYGPGPNSLSGDDDADRISPTALFIPLLWAGREVQKTKLPRAGGTTVVRREADILAGSNDVTVVGQFKPWNESSKQELRRILIATGIVKAMFGVEDVEWEDLPVMKNPGGVPERDKPFVAKRLSPRDKTTTVGR